MEIYFNPYPGAAKTEDEGISLAIGTADALLRLKKGCAGIILSSSASKADSDLPPSQFVLFRNANMEINIGYIASKTRGSEREKLLLLLSFFSKGKIITTDDLLDVEDWVISTVGTAAPVLELAAKNNAVALTIPTEEEWRTDVLRFDGTKKILHNLWGQEDISGLISHCLESIKKAEERFALRFNAVFCSGALNSAPNTSLWDGLGFFQTMEKVRKRNYTVDGNLIKHVGDTKYGALLELRLYGPGHRIFFVHRKDSSPGILVGGFYQKNGSLDQNDAIKNATKCADNYSHSSKI